MPKLTPRELDCIYWAAVGKSNKQIADILNISTHTVNYYLSAVSRKYKVNNRQAAILMSLKEHLAFNEK